MSLRELKSEVFQRRPVLKEIYENFGSLKLADYVKNEWKLSGGVDEKFLNIAAKFAAGMYGQEVGSQVFNQLKEKSLVSTIDHLGIWGHPIFVNADIIYSLYFKPSELAICLATESVSLNNTSSWSGSVLWHEGRSLRRASFFPDAKKTLPVFSSTVISKPGLGLFKKRAGIHSQAVLSALDISENARSFSEQASLSSRNLWQKVFPSAPKLIYLPLESIVMEYLAGIASDYKNNSLSDLIFTPKGQKLWQRYFLNEHTFMFWGIDEKNRRKKLDNLPVSANEIKALMNSRKIYPSSPLCFLALLFAGVSCVGGFTQTTWLSEVKNKYLDILKNFNVLPELIGRIESVPTKNFAESSLASLKVCGATVQPTALDLLNTGKDYYPEFVKKSKTLTLSESVDLAMPGIYEVVVK